MILSYFNYILPILHCKLGLANLIKEAIKTFIPEVIPTTTMMKLEERIKLYTDILKLIPEEIEKAKVDQQQKEKILEKSIAKLDQKKEELHQSKIKHKPNKRACMNNRKSISNPHPDEDAVELKRKIKEDSNEIKQMKNELSKEQKKIKNFKRRCWKPKRN